MAFHHSSYGLPRLFLYFIALCSIVVFIICLLSGIGIKPWERNFLYVVHVPVLNSQDTNGSRIATDVVPYHYVISPQSPHLNNSVQNDTMSGSVTMDTLRVYNSVSNYTNSSSAVIHPLQYNDSVYNDTTMGSVTMHPLNLNNSVYNDTAMPFVTVKPSHLNDSVYNDTTMRSVTMHPLHLNNSVYNDTTMPSVTMQPLHLNNSVYNDTTLGSVTMHPLYLNNSIYNDTDMHSGAIHPLHYNVSVYKDMDSKNVNTEVLRIRDIYKDISLSEYHRLLRRRGYESTLLHEFKSPYIVDPVLYDDAAIRKAPGKRATKIISCFNCQGWFNKFAVNRYNRDFRKCPHSECHFDAKGERLAKADLVLFFPGPWTMPPRPQGQIWAFCSWESPANYAAPSPPWTNVFNWTLSYRRNSDLFFPINRLAWKARDTLLSDTEYRRRAEFKTKTVAWFVSNCYTPSRREDYVNEMKVKLTMKYVDIDIYGTCGLGRCPYSVCLKALNDTYKFYLGFENSICQDYVTEKLFRNFDGRLHVIPVVRGGLDYGKYLPPNTFIDASSFKTAKDLALHLKFLGNDLDRYSQMLKEKDKLTTLNYKHDWCEACEKLHRGVHHKTIKDIRK